MNRVMGVFLATMAMLVSGGSFTHAAPDRQSEVYGDWTVRCVPRENLPPCDIVQFAKHRESGTQIMQFSVAYGGKGDSYGVQIILPLGILVAGGVLIRIDDETDLTDFAITRCEAVGCFVERMLLSKDIKPFETGSKGIIAVMDRDSRPLVIPLSFSGFSEALATMVRRNTEWAGKK